MSDDNQSQQQVDDNQPGAQEPTFSKDDIQKLMKQNFHGQEHIKNLETETATLRTQINELQEELSKTRTMEDFMAELRDTSDVTNPTGPTAPQLDKNELLAELKQQLLTEMTESQQKAQLEANWESAMGTLRDKHGDGFEAYVEQRAKELDLSNEQVTQMAATTPKAFLNLMSSGSSSVAPTTSSIRPPKGDNDLEAEAEFDRISLLRRDLSTPEGREANKLWKNPDWQRKQRERILARMEG